MLRESVLGKIYFKMLLFLKTFYFSFTYKALRTIKNFTLKVFKGSFLGKIFYREDKVFKYSLFSSTLRFIDKITGNVLAFFTKIYNKIRKFNKNSINYILFKFLNVNLKINFLNIMGIFIVAMSICPGARWNNIYGLLMAVILLFIYIFCTLSGKNYGHSVARFDFFMLLYMFTVLLGVFVSYDIKDSIRIFMFFVTSFIFMTVITGSLKNYKELDKFVGFVVVALIATSIYCIYQGIVGVDIDPTLVDISANAGMPGRAYSTFENPNNYAEFLVLLMPFMAAFMLNRKKKWQKNFGIICLIIPFTALLYTYSRSCWVSFAISLFVFIAFYNYKLLPLMILVGIIAVPFLPQTVLNRILTIGSMSDTSNHYRILIWDGVLKMLKKTWVTGIGLGPMAFSKIYPSFAHTNAVLAPHSHMLFMQILVETGIMGFLSFIAYWIMTLKRLITVKIKRNLNKETKNYVCASIASFTGVIFVCGVEYIFFYPRVMFTFFIVAGIIMSVINIARNEKIKD